MAIGLGENLVERLSNARTAAGLSMSRTFDRSRMFDRKNRTNEPKEHWIHKNITSKGCKRFVINENNHDLCFCGKDKAKHNDTAISNGESNPEKPWSNAIDGPEPTLGYGKIRFVNKPTDQTPDFVWISDDMLNTYDEKKKVEELMKSLWGLDEHRLPNLLISVTGGVDFKFSSILKDNFIKGLCEAAKSVNAWIVTGGIDKGVITLIGDELKGEITTIGVTPWGIVKNRNSLLREDNNDTRGQQATFDYEIKDSEKMEGEIALNPHHTHFFLVDSGADHTSGGEIHDFLINFELENFIPQMYQKCDCIPTIIIIVNGGYNTATNLMTKHKDIPRLVIKGSGGIADIIANAHANSESKDGLRSLSKYAKRKVDKDIDKHFPNLEESRKKEIMRCVREVIKIDNLLTIYCLESKEIGIDHAILNALIKSKTENDSAKKKMTMAIMWNRLELGKQILEGKTGGVIEQQLEFDTEDGFTLMELAIHFDKEQFIPLIIENTKDFEMKKFLTYKRLTEYYQYEDSTKFGKKRFFKMIKKILPKRRLKQLINEHIELEDIGYLLWYILGGGFAKLLLQKDQHSPYMENPFDMLLIYCVLNGMDKMADLLWKYTDSPIATALICTRIYRYYAENTDYLEAYCCEDKNQYLSEATKYENYACKSLTQCPELYNKDDTYLLLSTKHKFWDQSIIQMANLLWNEKFLSHGVVQNYLSYVWMGKIKCSKIFKDWLIVPIPFLLSYEKIENENTPRIDSLEKDTDIEKSTKVKEPNETKSSLKWYQEIEACYTAPIVKCRLHYMCFVVFLLFYIKSLSETNDRRCAVSKNNSVDSVDIWLFLYVIGTFPTEINQVINNPASNFPAKLWNHFSSFYNWIDGLAIITYTTSFMIRVTTLPIPQQEYLQPTSCQYVLPFVKTYYNETMDAYNIAYYLDIITFIFYALRMMLFFKNYAQLGPKVVMVFAMLKDLGFFVVLLFMFVIIYAVGAQALVLPNRRSNPLTPDYFFHLIFFRPYLLAMGEFQTDQYIEDFLIDHCKATDIEDSLRGCGEDGDWKDLLSTNYIASVHYYLFIALTIFYIMTVTILLVNLLIAIFSNTYTRLQEHSKELFLSERAQLILEFKDRTIFPNPFSILEHVWRCCQWITIKKKGCKLNGLNCNPFNKLVDDQEAKLKKKEADLKYNTMTKIEKACCRGFLLIKDEEQDGYVKDQLKEMKQNQKEIKNMLDNSNKDEEQDNVKDQLKEMKQNLNKVKNMLDNSSLGPTRPDEVREKPIAGALEQIAVSEKPIEIHIDSRNSPYPKTEITRTEVPDHKVPWQVRWKDYAPVEYTKTREGTGKKSTYIDGKKISREMIASFNRFEHGINRKSLLGQYSIGENGRPINPRGRTGMSGKGNLKRWGPNHQGDVVITRFKASKGVYAEEDGRRILQFVAARKHGQWAIPGGRADEGTEMVEVLAKQFCEEALGSLDMGEEKRKEAMRMVEKQLGLGITVYQGYVDDPNNTDNAWFETTAVNYHDSDGSSFSMFKLSGADTPEEQLDTEKGPVAKWITLDQDVDLYANHEEIMEKVCFHRNAYSPLKDVTTLVEVDSGSGKVLKKKRSSRWGIIVGVAEQK